MGLCISMGNGGEGGGGGEKSVNQKQDFTMLSSYVYESFISFRRINALLYSKFNSRVVVSLV